MPAREQVRQAVVGKAVSGGGNGADWGAIAAEYLHGAPPATPLGQAEADFFATRGRRAGVGLDAAG